MEKSIRIMKEQIVQILKENDPTIYLFGSIVLDDFQLGWSDIDILCLTQKDITDVQAIELVNLRQSLLEKDPDNKYYRSFEGGILALDTFLHNQGRTVYWGTSGQRITEDYVFDTFSMIELLENGRLLYGVDVRDKLPYPSRNDLIKAVMDYYAIIRKYAVQTTRSLYSVGWLFDTARCIYTLRTGKVIAKTQAGIWALENNIVPDVEIIEKALEIRKNPIAYKDDEDCLKWMESLGEYVQEFADILEKELNANGYK